jgi:hypothetical protein
MGWQQTIAYFHAKSQKFNSDFNPLNAKLNPICHLLALLGAHPILHVSRIRVNQISSFSTGFCRNL